MQTSKLLWLAALGAVVAGSASATSFTLNLTAAPPTFVSATTISGLVFSSYNTVIASGLDSTNQITVQNGDTITENIAFSQPFQAPTDGHIRYDYLLLDLAPGEPGLCCSFPNFVTLYDAGQQVFSAASGSGDTTIQTTAFLPKGLVFDALTDVISISGTPETVNATFNQSTVTKFTISALLEPATWMMMLVGFAGLGATLRSRSTSRRFFSAQSEKI